MSRVAVITGAASGMGLQVATQLANKKGWKLHLLDRDEIRGKEVAAGFGNHVARFHKADVTSYSQLSTVFEDLFQEDGQIDFVYANAGVSETGDFYAVPDGSGPPAELNQLVININLKAVVDTCYLAKHYMIKSPHEGQGASIVITASAGSLYHLDSAPMYAGSKFGALGFAWSIAHVLHKRHGIRVNAVLPAPVRTNLVSDKFWSAFDQSQFTSVSQIANVVLKFVDGKTMTDAKGVTYAEGEVFGAAAEVVKDDIFFAKQQEWSSAAMKQAMSGNDL